MTVAIIPARGNSKRIPRKNIRPFGGLPMISYSITAARNTNLFDRVIVSTDSDEIAETAVKYGAEVPFMRPASLAGDIVGIGAAVAHALEWLSESGYPVKTACCIYATAPLIQPEHICRGYELFKNSGAASAMSVTSFAFPVQRALLIGEQGNLHPVSLKGWQTRSQDLPEAYHDAGQFVWLDVDAFLEIREFLMDKTVPVLIPRHFVQDIDTPEDWETAEMMLLALKMRSEKQGDAE